VRPSINRITLLRDTDGDGIAETRTVFLKGLNSPLGMALVGNDLYVANTDAVMRLSLSRRRHADHASRRQGRRPYGVSSEPPLDEGTSPSTRRVADDVGNTVWRVTPAARQAVRRSSSRCEPPSG
jgi:hypothetical protein